MLPKHWVNLAFGIAALFLVLVLGQVLDMAWDFARLPVGDLPVSYPALIAVILGVLVFVGLKKNQKTCLFMNEVVLELGKVTWPVKKETLLSAVIVVIMVSIASVVLFLFDS